MNILRSSFLLSLVLVISALVTVYEGNLAILFFSVFWLFCGGTIIKIFINRENYPFSINIFLFFYLIYYVYSFVVYKVYINDPSVDYFVSIDSYKFYTWTNDLVYGFNSWYDTLINISQTFLFSDTRGYFYLSTSVGFLASLIDYNGYFVQQLIITFLASLIPVFLYNISLNFLNSQKSRKISIVYGMLSYLLVYSANLLRDVHISFLFIVGFYLFFKRKSINGILLLLFLAGITWTFRVEHGISFMFLILIYLFLYVKENKDKPAKNLISFLIFSGVISLALINLNITDMLLRLVGTTSRYTSLAEETANQSGLGVKLLALPVGIREFARTIFSQLEPFPAYLGLSTSRGVIKYLAFPLIITGFFWFMVWTYLVYGLNNKKIRNKIDSNLFVALIFAFAIIIGASSGSGDVRRIMAVYPVIFLVASFVYFHLSYGQRSRMLTIGILLYIGLHAVYEFLKF